MTMGCAASPSVGDMVGARVTWSGSEQRGGVGRSILEGNPRVFWLQYRPIYAHMHAKCSRSGPRLRSPLHAFLRQDGRPCAFTPPRSTATMPLPPAAPAPPPPAGSNRNASNAHLPIPSAPPNAPNAAALGQDGQTAPTPGLNVNGAQADKGVEVPTGKPVNVPSGSKRSIIVNARQVGFFPPVNSIA